MTPSEAHTEGDTKSPLMNPDGSISDSTQLRVHFYHLKYPSSPAQQSPWWLRAFWWPRPTFSHCSVQWGSFVHNMTIKEGTGLHHVDEWREKNPAQLMLVVPVHVDFKKAVELVAHFEHASVQKWKVFLWWSRISRRHVPVTCASLVTAWLKAASVIQPATDAHIILSCAYNSIATPDELFDNLVKCWNVQQFEVIEYA